MMQFNNAILLVFDNTKVMKPPAESMHKDFHTNVKDISKYSQKFHQQQFIPINVTQFASKNTHHSCLAHLKGPHTAYN